MLSLSTILLYRMTHIDNIPHILKNGITHSSSAKRNKNYVAIGDGSLINARSLHEMPNEKFLGDYTPFYLGPRMPMLFVMQKGYNMVMAVNPEDIVYCITSAKSILDLNLDFVFTDGHAVDGFSEFYYPKDLKRINSLLDWKAIKGKYWKNENDLDLKRRKEAEFLVCGDIPVQAIESFVVYSEAAATKLQEMAGYKNQPVIVNRNYYF